MSPFPQLTKRSFWWSLFLCFTLGQSVAQQFDWAQSIGGLGLDVGRAVTTDSDGNVIVVGSFSGGTHIADTFVTGYGTMEAFVAKFTSDGDFLWARVISGPAEDMARGVVTEDNGNIFVVGHFTDTVVFSITQTDTIAAGSEGGQDIFVVKYSPNGDLLWHFTGGGTEDDTATDIDRYKWSGKLYVSGGFQKRARFGAGSVLSNGLTDAFLAKFDPDGNVHWVRNGGGLEHDIAASVAVDQTNETVYIVGDFYDQASFDGVQLQALGSSDMFLAQFNEAGDLNWARTNGGTSVDVATGVGTDLNGKIYVSGYYQGTTFFQNYSVSALSYNDVFLSRFDQDGNCDWLRSAGSWGLDNCLGMAVAWDGTTYLTGMFEEEIFADGISATGNGYDIFILNYAPSGDVRYAKTAGAGSADIAMATCLGPDESVYVTGYYYFFADFDQTTIGNADNGDCFLARMTDILDLPEEGSKAETPCLHFDMLNNQIVQDCGNFDSWRIYNSLGQIVLSGSVQQQRVDASFLKPGYYWFSGENQDSRNTIRFVIR
jgi:hypothetical protein